MKIRVVGFLLVLCLPIIGYATPPRPLKIIMVVKNISMREVQGTYVIKKPHGLGSCEGFPEQIRRRSTATFTCKVEADAWEARDVTLDFNYKNGMNESASVVVHIGQSKHDIRCWEGGLECWFGEEWDCGSTGPCTVKVTFQLAEGGNRRR